MKKSKTKSTKIVIPRGRPISGRVWKNQKRKRISSLRQGETFKTSFEEKMLLKKSIENVKERSRALKAARKQAFEDKRKRVEDNKKRREENERKSEVVQQIKNPAKLRRLKKKQLRGIEKR